MPSRVHPARSDATTAHACTAACPPWCATAALDELLFEPDQWFAIDKANHKVAGVAPGTLDRALALVGRGRVATIVGRLRPQVVAVDVDAGGPVGDQAVQLVRDWCVARGLWHLQRLSGGAPGRWHLLVVPGVHRDALVEEISKVRSQLGLTRPKDLDALTYLRPLSAPHRITGAPTPPDGLKCALSGLQSVLEPVSDRLLARRQRLSGAERRSERPRAAGGPAEALTPLLRPRRPLPPHWTAYLERGRRAATAVGLVDRDPTTRSQLELEATTQLVLAGYTADQAWAAIIGAHRTAFTKARARGRRWWWNVWNRAVVDADDWLRARRVAAPCTAPALVATTATRAALDGLWRTWAPRTRHTDREVLTVVLDRMDRVGATAVPIPQRDLVLDCAIASRTTVRAALTRLQAAGLLVVEATYVRGTTDTAHTLRLPEHLPQAPPAQDDSQHHSEAVSLADPSGVQPPHRRPPLFLRRALGLPTTHVLAHLPDHDDPQGIALSTLTAAAGLLEHDQDTPTARQLRTARAHLRSLAGHGLADVDQHGRWRASSDAISDASVDLSADSIWSSGAATVPAGDRPAARVHGRTAADTTAPTPPGQRLHQFGYDLDARIRQRVDDERAQFRARVDPAARRARWEQQRHAAIARAAKAARAHQKAWWDAQPTAAAHRRRTALAAAFAALPPAQQAAHKQRLAQQRTRAGEDERTRYDGWLTSLTTADLDQRSVQRALSYAHRSQLEQHQLVAAWTDHRTRWDLPHYRTRTDATSSTGAGSRRDGPEAHLLARTYPDVGQLVLDDALAQDAVTRPTGTVALTAPA